MSSLATGIRNVWLQRVQTAIIRNAEVKGILVLPAARLPIRAR